MARTLLEQPKSARHKCGARRVGVNNTSYAPREEGFTPPPTPALGSPPLGALGKCREREWIRTRNGEKTREIENSIFCYFVQVYLL